LYDKCRRTRACHRGTEQLISSDEVEGTAVYDRSGAHLGTVNNLMIDKYTGQVAYAGGFLGNRREFLSGTLEDARLRHPVGRLRRGS
jgi:hypothetical protein